MTNETPIQTKVIEQLAKAGFRVNGTTRGYEPNTIDVMMSRKRRHTTHCAEIDANGLVNGEPVNSFLARLKR